MGELIASDVLRGTEGNRNKFSRSTEKVFDPPLYEELFDATEIDLYDRLFGSSDIDEGVYTQLIQNVAEKLDILRGKIERAYELQCAQIMQTGVVTLVNQDSVDFRRKSASMVANNSGNTWATDTVDPFQNIADGCKFIRTVGKSGDTVFNLILGDLAMPALFNNAKFKDRVTQNLNNNIDSLNIPRRNAEGADLLGQLSCYNYKVNLWSYPQYYQTSVGGSMTPYIDPKCAIILPTSTDFTLSFAAVPQVLIAPNQGMGDVSAAPPAAQEYVFDHWPDVANSAHKMRVKSAGLAIPKSVDRIYNFYPVA